MKQRTTELITAGVIFLLTMILCVTQPFYAIDHLVTDIAYQRTGTRNKQIKIIKIDEKTLETYGPVGEWERDIPAKLVECLTESEDTKPAVLAFDVMYIGEKEPLSDAYFAETCQEAGNVISAANIVYKTKIDRYEEGGSFVNARSIERIETPYPALAEAGNYGFANTLQDKDGYIRQTQLFVSHEGQQTDSFAYAVYKAYQEKKGKEAVTPLLDENNQTEFGFSGRIGDYEAVSLCDVLDGTVDTRVFKDCIVLVGAYAPGMQDSYNVAVEKGKQMYGVEIHANIIEALLEGNFSQPANLILTGLLMAVAAVLFYLLIRKKNVVFALCSLIIFTVAEIGLGIFLRGKGVTICLLYLPIVLILTFVYKIFSQYLIEKMRRKKTLNAFKKYVAPQIVEELSHKNNLEIKLGGENREIAVLFVDIRGFTTMSESMEPEQVVEILNEYLSLTTNAIFQNNGTLDKFVGDATMAVFNAPFDLDDYVFRAVCTARDIAAGSKELEEKIMEKYGKKVGFGIGVNCGPAVVGNIGCEVRMDYTAIGDTVNTAARLESNAKSGQILISQAVYEAVKDRVEATAIGEIPLKGKAKGVLVYSLDEVKGETIN